MYYPCEFGERERIRFLDILNPKVAVISVGEHNKYGHPAESTLELLRNKDIKILRTDREGDIDIMSDGDGFGLGR